jgi:hypothetical protein
MPGGFPGFSFGQQTQKGEALKEYVRGIRKRAVSVLKWRLECRLDGDGEAREAGSCHWTRRRRVSHSSKIPVIEG